MLRNTDVPSDVNKETQGTQDILKIQNVPP